MDGRTLSQYLEQLEAEKRYLAYLNENQPNGWQALLLLSPFLLGFFLIFLITCLPSSAHNELVPAIDEPGDDNAIPANIDMANESLNEGILKSVGLDDTKVRDHRRLGFFYDFSLMNIPDEPVVLNTGDIVDEQTANALVNSRVRLPRGEVTGFYKSYQLKNLLNTLVEDEVESQNRAAPVKGAQH